MITNIPDEIISPIEASQHFRIKTFSPIPGGCINNGGKLSTSEGYYFLKWNTAHQYPGMFEAEAKGLSLLKYAKALHVPKVLCYGSVGAYQYIVMEFVESKPRSPDYWRKFGIRLATLHQNTSAYFGLDHNNYIGSLLQSNQRRTKWIDFFIEERLEFQLRLALDKGLADRSLQNAFSKVYTKLRDILPDEKPALVHGDLWSGNLITNSSGEPCIIDPAVHYGHREADLAMTQLFGAFHPDYLDAYQEVFPLMYGFEDRVDIYNLYPLLVHLNLFGSSYRNQIDAIIRRFF